MSDAQELAQQQIRGNIALTDRWAGIYEMKSHRMQSLLMYNPARFKSCVAGRRAGKTEVAKRDGVRRLPVRSAHAKRFCYAAPTYTRAKEIFFDDLDKLIPSFWVKSRKESLSFMEFKMHWGDVIRLVGMDNPRVVEGTPWDRFYCDEFPSCPTNCFQRNIRPALSTLGRFGSCWTFGKPDEFGDNQVEHEKLFDVGLRWGTPSGNRERASFWWSTRDILPPEEIHSMISDMDELTIDQEIDALFVKAQGVALPKFDPKLHANYERLASYSPFLPIDHVIDFGSQNSASLVAQNYKGYAWILDEIPLRGNGDTEEHCEQFMQRCIDLHYDYDRIGVYGDAAGRTPSSPAGESDYDRMRDIYETRNRINVDWNQLLAAPSIRDTINAIRGRLRNYRGEVRLHIHPRCKRLIEEMRTARWPDKEKLRNHHLLACLRYYLYSLYGDAAGTVQVGTASLVGEDATIFNSRF